MSDRILLNSSDWENVLPSSSSSSLHSVKVMEKAKKRARGDLEDLSEFFMQQHALSTDPLLSTIHPTSLDHGIAREDIKSLSVDDFIKRYESPSIPCIITNAANDWPAFQDQRWTPNSLYAKFRHRKFRCGEDDNGKVVKVKLKHFLRYMKTQEDDSPLYIFDSMFDDNNESKKSCPIKEDYTIPSYFSEDLLSLVGENRRPPYRWFLLGPRRSGTAIHIDPLSTSAWNTLIFGLKRWILIPPDVSKEIAKSDDLVDKEKLEDNESIDYFLNILPRLKKKMGEAFTSRIIEFFQLPGETVFVPSNWWHAVLYVQDSCAVTQNYASSGNFERMWLAARTGRRGMARKWLRVLRTVRPDLALLADKLNERDGWSESIERQKHILNKERRRLARELPKVDDESNDNVSSESSDSNDEECVEQNLSQKHEKRVKKRSNPRDGQDSSSEEQEIDPSTFVG
jgi:histone arginine demethylase JMJD6